MPSRVHKRGRRTTAALWVVAAASSVFALLPVAPSWQVRLFLAALCHQRPERTLTLFGETMAVCARCSGLYVGAAAATLLAAALSRSLWWPHRVWFLLACLPTAVDAVLPWFGLPQLSPIPRHALAWPAGFAAGWFFSLAVASLMTRPETSRYGTSVEVVDG